MKKTITFILLAIGLVVIDSIGQVGTLLDHNLPPGWKFKSFDVSRSGTKALYLIPDLPDEVLLTEKFPSRLQVFSTDNILITDLPIEENFSFSKFTRNDRIILCQGEESGCDRIRVLDLLGKELYTINAEGRWPIAAPLGKEIALVPGPEEVGSVSIIDEDTGREKAKIGPPALRDKYLKIAAFFPLGEDGFYVQGIGATLCLKSYLHRGEVYWQVQDIGGNIKSGLILSDEHLAIRFGMEDLSEKRFMAGVAVVEWRTGRVLFKKKAYQTRGIQDQWFSQLESLSIVLDEEDNLVFYGDPNDVLKLPRLSGKNSGWNESRSQKKRLSPDQLEIIRIGDKFVRPEARAGKYIIKDFGDSVRIEKSKYVDIR